MGSGVKYQKYTIGAIIEIEIQNGEYYCYGQLLDYNQCVIFDFKSENHLSDFDFLTDCKILCRVTIDNDIITTGTWKKIGYLQLRADFRSSPRMYIFHDWDNSFYLYDILTVTIVHSDKKECRGLERCVVWSSSRLEDRIQAHFDRLPCKWMKQHYDLFLE